MLLRILFLFIAFTFSPHVLAACIPAATPGDVVPLADKKGTVRLVSQDNVDLSTQSTISQSYALLDAKRAPSEAQVRAALNQLYEKARSLCRKTALTGVQIFLYKSPATAEGSSWIAKLQTEKMQPVIEVRANMVSASTKDVAQACDPGKEPGNSLNLLPKLPPLAKRKILGTWADSSSSLTVSLDEVSGTVYKVYRSKYCSSGEEGEPLRKAKQGRFYRKDSSSGDYYVILSGGELGVFDKQGKIDALPVHEGLFPRK